MKEIKIYFATPFKYKTFEDFIRESNLKNKENFLKLKKYIKTLKDLQNNDDEIISDRFSLFLDIFNEKIKSINKSSARIKTIESNEIFKTNQTEQKNFFKDQKIYHLHLIKRDIYNQKHKIDYKNGQFITDYDKPINEDKCGPISKENLQGMDGYYQTSKWILHYQKNEEENKYKILFITEHPKGECADENEFKYSDIYKLLEEIIHN